MGEISITKLLVVAALVVLLFGTKKLRTLGGDLGAAIKGGLALVAACMAISTIPRTPAVNAKSRNA